jgi:hypothetical protein
LQAASSPEFQRPDIAGNKEKEEEEVLCMFLQAACISRSPEA